MSANLKKHISFIEFICSDTISEKQTKYVVSCLTINQLKAIREVLLNLLNGQFKLSPKILLLLKKQKSLIRKLSLNYKLCRSKFKILIKVLKFVKKSLFRALSE